MFAKGLFLSMIFIAALLMPCKSNAHPPEKKRVPTAVLVQLRAEQNRRDALIEAKNYSDLEILKRDANKAIEATVRDFRDHFTACPVFYYMDSNFDKIMAHQFDGVLLDENLAPVAHPNIEDSNYLIVFYGYPTWQTRKGKWDTTKQKIWGGAPNGRALVVNNHRFKQIHYIYNLDFDFFNFRKRKAKNPYHFESKKFDIEYYPSAAEFNRNFLYAKQRQKKK